MAEFRVNVTELLSKIYLIQKRMRIKISQDCVIWGKVPLDGINFSQS